MGVFRLFLSLSVLLGHTSGHGLFGLSFLERELAVQTFFMISGFYMALVLNEKYNRPGQYGLFLKQRFFRLYPTYFILIVTVILIDVTVYAVTGRPWGSLKVWHDNFHLLSPGKLVFFVVPNLIIFGQDLMPLFTLDQISGRLHLFCPSVDFNALIASNFLLIVPSWSLAVEFSFYVLAPFLVRRPAREQIAIFILCLIVRASVYWAFYGFCHAWTYNLFAPNLFFFMAGSLSYVLYKNHPIRLREIALSSWWIFVIFGFLGLDYRRFPYAQHLYLIWLPLVFVMMPLLFALTCRNRLDRLIGELSYPCYLIHAHVLMFTLALKSIPAYQWLTGPVSVVLTLALSWLFYRFIETKTERFRENLYQKSLKLHPQHAISKT